VCGYPMVGDCPLHRWVFGLVTERSRSGVKVPSSGLCLDTHTATSLVSGALPSRLEVEGCGDGW
jgi:hypothetical protein